MEGCRARTQNLVLCDVILPSWTAMASSLRFVPARKPPRFRSSFSLPKERNPKFVPE